MKRIVSLLIVTSLVIFGCGDPSKKKDDAKKTETKTEEQDTAKAPSTDENPKPDTTPEMSKHQSGAQENRNRPVKALWRLGSGGY